MMKTKVDTGKKLTASFALIIVLSVCFAATTFALVDSMVKVRDNIFMTGSVGINLNDKKAIITENEFLFEPGMTVKKDFFVENEGSAEIYYKLYFDNVSGGLSDVLQIKICDGSKVLYEGTASELSKANVSAADDILRVGERRDLEMYFHFPEDAGNSAKHMTLSFDFAADAVQIKNNSLKEFN
ncbi:MAG: hypothetical protein Q4B31_03500 [Clostridia bacterium]|nr:hypothetical protein [Clostridia bacterium]